MRGKKPGAGRRGGNHSSFRLLSFSTIIYAVVMVVALAAASFVSYTLITNRIIETAIESMEELARHDEQAIQTSLNHRWSVLGGIGRNLSARKPQTTDELLDLLHQDDHLVECLRLTLVADSGDTLDSAMDIASNEALLAICNKSGDRFARQLDCTDSPIDDQSDVLALGTRIEPFTVEGRTFTHLAALMDIDAIQDELLILSYGGRGYSSVIDRDGNFIVQLGRGSSALAQQNFYEQIERGQLQKGFTVGQIRNRINSGLTFSLRYVTEDGDSRVISFTPMEETGWYFASSVSRAVFEEQSVSLMTIILLMLLMMLAIIVIAVIVILRRRSKMLALEIQHREEITSALELAEQSNRAKTTFLSNMSHDIRTPMNAIIGFTTLAGANADNPERVRDYLEKINLASAHLLSLINDVLDMSRIESGKMRLNTRQENLPEILHNLHNMVNGDIQKKQLSLNIDTVNVVNENVVCDKLRLNQMLLNLMSNAIKYTPEGGSIYLRLIEKKPPQSGYALFEFRVKDTGIGMSPEFVRTIFEPFTRERNSTVSGIQGTGLGMAITKSIVDLMSGSIKVTSEPGNGSEFVVELTFKLEVDRPAGVGVIDQLSGMRALVVDDNKDTCLSVTQMLKQLGMRPEWASKGNEAVSLARKAAEGGIEYNVFILDWQMPGLSGLETARQLRETLGIDAPIIAFSAYDWSDIEEQAHSVGITEFLSKPLFASELRDALVNACVSTGEQPASQEPEAEGEIFSGRRILLTEDNELNREIAIEILEEVGFEVESAENGQIAVDKLCASEPGYYDLILMDVQMPVMNGHDASRAIRALEDARLSQIPIIAMTANAFEEDKRAALNAGMNGHLGKPIDVPALLAMLSAILSEQPPQE